MGVNPAEHTSSVMTEQCESGEHEVHLCDTGSVECQVNVHNEGSSIRQNRVLCTDNRHVDDSGDHCYGVPSEDWSDIANHDKHECVDITNNEMNEHGYSRL